jgi:hypothetical protein
MMGDSGYVREMNFLSKMKFSKGNLTLNNTFPEYVELKPFKERFLLQQPILSVHNLIIGSPYLDAQGKGYIRNLACPNDQYVEIEFHKKGWSKSNHYKVDGQVYSGKDKVAYKIEGRWNESMNLIDCTTGESEEVWRKSPYPENWEFMYGMNQH